MTQSGPPVFTPEQRAAALVKAGEARRLRAEVKELLKTGARMVADRPVLGVGVAQFYALYPKYVSPELQRSFRESLGRA